MAANAMVPLFVVGVPRSGTTLLSAMLNAHPRIAMTPETFFVEWALRHRHADLGEDAVLDELLDDYAGGEPFRQLGLEQAAVRERFRAGATRSFAALLTTLLSLYAEARDKPRAGEKTPRHYLYVATLSEWFPGAPVINVVRDPRAVAASLLRVSWAADDVETHAWRWLRAVTRTEDPRVLTVRYEDLVRDPQPCLQQLCEGIGETYDRAMLDFAGGARDLVAGEAHKSNVLAPLDDTPVHKWREQLSPQQVALIEHITRRGMQRHGYRPEGSGLGLGARLGVRARWLAERARSAGRSAARAGEAPRS